MTTNSVKITNQQIRNFQKFIHWWFSLHGRTHLPWRQNYDPYQIMVSEIMLQQTQVERVIPKFNQFISSYPTAKELAEASTADLLRHWQGLGYNRRALNLQKAAQKVTSEFAGQMPKTKEQLLSLPGVGPYTATAIRVFAYNQPETVIETNIRTVFLHHFVPTETQVSDEILEPLIEATLDSQNPRLWYSALMDYGSYLKSVLPNPSRRSKMHQTQSTFAGSNRQLRGAIIRHLALKDHQTPDNLLDTIPEAKLFDREKILAAIAKLVEEGFLQQKQNYIRLKK